MEVGKYLKFLISNTAIVMIVLVGIPVLPMLEQCP